MIVPSENSHSERGIWLSTTLAPLTTLAAIAAVIGLTSIGLNATEKGVAWQGACVLGVAVGFAVILGSTRLQANSDGLVIVNTFTVLRAGWSEIADMSGDNGLKLTLVSGRSIGSTAYGSSVIGLLTGNRRARHLSACLRERGGDRLGEASDWAQDHVDASFRRASLLWPLAGGLVGTAYVLSLMTWR